MRKNPDYLKLVADRSLTYEDDEGVLEQDRAFSASPVVSC